MNVTANDSKSTPKKAERHPLALLAETWRAAAGPVYGPEEAVFQQCADELESALRAQAEAEATWKARMNHACLRLDMLARSAASVGHARQAEIWTAAGDIVSEEYRAALAQAGGEAL